MKGAETIGERLRRLRMERGLTQHDVAAPGVSAQYISKVERGERNASVKALRKLAANLGVNPGYLETGQDGAALELREFMLDDAELALRLRENPGDAEQTFRRVLAEAQADGDRRSETRARLGLGTIAAHHGDHIGAVELLESATGESWVTPLSQPDTFATLGRSYVSLGRGTEAAALFRSCLDQVNAHPPVNSAIAARFATQLTCVLVDMDLLDDAREAVRDGLRHGTANGDPYTAMRLHWSSARLSASAGELDVARASIDRAIALLETVEDTANLGRAHVVAAEISLLSAENDIAAEHLETARQLLPDGSSIEDRGYLTIQRAFLAARTGNAADAIDLANSGLRLLADHDDPIVRGQAHWALGEAYASAGAGESARDEFIQASGLIPAGTVRSAQMLEAWQRAVPA